MGFSFDFYILILYNYLTMKKTDDSLPILNKIEIDENQEPVIIEVPAEKPMSASHKRAIERVEKHRSKKVKQLYMNSLLGYEDEEKITKRQKIFKNVCIVLFFVFVIGVLGWTAYNDFGSGKSFPSWAELSLVFEKSWFYIIFAVFSLFLCYFFKGLKLAIMCKLTTGKFHLKTCIETGVIGHYYNSVTPLAVGGQPFEIYHLSKHGVHGGSASSLPIVAFFLNQFAFVILGIMSLLLYSTNALGVPEEIMPVATTASVIAVVGLICCFSMPFLVLLFSMFPKAGASIVHFGVNLGGKLKLLKDPKKTAFKTTKAVLHNSRCIKKITKSPAVLISTFILSLGEQLALSSIAYFTLKFFGFDWPAANIAEWAQVVSLCLILYAAVSFIPTPGNSGAADLSFYLLFETGLVIGATKVAGLAWPAMMVWRLLSFYSFVIIGFIFTSRKRKQDKLLEKKQAEEKIQTSENTENN